MELPFKIITTKRWREMVRSIEVLKEHQGEHSRYIMKTKSEYREIRARVTLLEEKNRKLANRVTSLEKESKKNRLCGR